MIKEHNEYINNLPVKAYWLYKNMGRIWSKVMVFDTKKEMMDWAAGEELVEGSKSNGGRFFKEGISEPPFMYHVIKSNQ